MDRDGVRSTVPNLIIEVLISLGIVQAGPVWTW